MQESDNITMARDIQQYGLKITQLWLSGYDRTLLAQYSSLMQGRLHGQQRHRPLRGGHD